jgi:hypothetical protein
VKRTFEGRKIGGIQKNAARVEKIHLRGLVGDGTALKNST